MVRKLTHMGVFESGGQNYLFVEQGGWRWKSVFQLKHDDDGKYKLEELPADRPDVFRDAILSTKAYSRERRQYVRFVDRATLEFLSDENRSGAEK